MTFTLFTPFNEPLPPEPVEPSWALPIRPNLTDASIQDVLIDNVEKADRLLALLNRVPIGAIAIDTEFGNSRPVVDLGKGRWWSDPRSIVPLILSGAVWLPEQNRVLRFAMDLRIPEIAPKVGALLRLNVMVVAHYIQAELHTMWALGIDPVLHQTYDTYVAARALDLGRGFQKVAIETADQDDDPHLVGPFSLLGQCARYGINHPFASAKDQLQQSFVEMAPDAPFNTLQIRYAMADAEATLKLYLAQQTDVIAAGLHPHLHQVEFPFAEANARIAWDGVPVDPSRLADLRQGLQNAVGLHRSTLQEAGLTNPGSPNQVREFLTNRGHGDRLHRHGKSSTEDAILEQIEPLDDTVTHIRRYRKYSGMLADRLFDGSLVGADGRLHPKHNHLAAATGRNSCSAPNIAGITKTFRPVVVAPEGRALVELDFAQIEVCIAAAVHGDADLLAAANSSDVYAAMAQQFYADDLTDAHRALDTASFKREHGDLRDKMKVFVLATLYNMQARGIADQFRVALTEAQRQREAFLAQFPGIAAAMRSAGEDGSVRGFAPVTGGLRRQIAPGAGAVNKLINTPIQATAGVVFRHAVIDLYKHYRRTPTQIILPIHDAVLVECDQADVDQVVQEASLIMTSAVRAYFPELAPRIDVNTEATSCWNKDGHEDSLENFLKDPSFKL